MAESNQSERAYQRLLAAITDWTLMPGAPLAEVELSQRLAVSRTPLREALGRLRREGLVEQEAGQSARVAPVSVERTVALFQAREALETYALRLAARASDREEFRDLSRAFASLAAQAAPAPDAIYALSRRFDEAVTRTAGNAQIIALLGELYVQLARLRRLSADNPDRLRATARQHADIADAVYRGDGPGAARAQSNRLQDGLETIVSLLSGGLLGPDDEDIQPLQPDAA